MRSYCFIVLNILLFSCHAPVPETKPVLVDTLTTPDELLVNEPGLHLKASKKDSGELCFHYQLADNDTMKTFYFKYLNYSDVVFPAAAIGLLNGTKLRIRNYLVVRDSLFILPVIGMQDGLSVFIYNLRSMEMIVYDMRTSFELLWLNEQNMTFFMAASPQQVNDSLYSYELKKYKLTANDVKEISRHKVGINIDRIHEQEVIYNIAKSELQ